MGRLEAKEVTIRYRTEGRVVTAVEGVSFTVEPGEKFIILGPSGCGKSTLLKAIAGFVPAAGGAIELAGRPVGAPGPDRVVVFQEFDQLLPWRTVLDNVAYPLRLTKRVAPAEREAHALRFVRMVGLEPFRDAYPHTLSGGMKQRAAIARALALNPEMLLMDEPFAALDALTRARMQDELNGIWRQMGTTIIFVTHSIEEAIVLGTRILILSRHPGRVRAILDNPAAAPGAPPEARLQAEQAVHALLDEGDEA